ncbi:MAG: CotH kinase family protein [Bacteroidaceae bacterium]|nr:CotH kinase family protein [Bacteroidaceae bacterium]
MPMTLHEALQIGLPVVEVTTVNEEEPTADPIDHPKGSIGGSITNASKVPGSVKVWLPDSTLAYESQEYIEGESGMTIKIRGNWSGRSAKKPYKIKLQKKADLLHRGDSIYYDKDWLLLRDQWMNLNTLIGLRVNQLIGMQWTPASEPVILLFNGDFRGLYRLSESVKRNPQCRIDVDKRSGYIIEYDAYWWNEDVSFMGTLSDTRFRYSFKHPDTEDITEQQLQYIQDAVCAMEASIADGTYPEHIDVSSFAKWMLAHDILGNSDGGGSNMYITKYDSTASSLFMMGNLWDFDMIMQTDEKWSDIRNSNEHYFRRLFNSPNHQFMQTYAELWEQDGATLIDTLIDELCQLSVSNDADVLNQARQLDVLRWNLCPYVSVEEDVDNAIDWFVNRKVWLDENVQDSSIFTQIHDIIMPTHQSELMFDLCGRRVDNIPRQHGIVIRNGKKLLIR